MNTNREKLSITVDIGPYTVVLLAEIILIVLKILTYITYSWLLVLSPIILIIGAASFILLLTFLKLLRNNLF
jgi:hypothetical protein